MLIPRYSIRSLMVITTLAAGLALAARHAVRGEVWAIGVFVAAATALAQLLVFATVFVVAHVITGAGRASRGGLDPTTESPANPLPAWSMDSDEE